MENMNTTGLIACSELVSELERLDKGLQVQKIMVREGAPTRWVQQHFPSAEIVKDSGSLLGDERLKLLIIASPAPADMELVAQALAVGKQVRII